MHIIREGGKVAEDWGGHQGIRTTLHLKLMQYYTHYCTLTLIVTYTCIVITRDVYISGEDKEKEA